MNKIDNTDNYLHKIKEYIGRFSGMYLENFRGSVFTNRIDERIKHFKFDSYRQYYEYLSLGSKSEVGELISLLTVNETFFFRDRPQFDYLSEHIFRKAANQIVKPYMKILSIGCSSGDEPYSIAMCAAEEFGDNFSDRIEIMAYDIDREVLELAKNKKYSETTHRLNNLPPTFKEKYLVKEDHKYSVSPKIKRAVGFKILNAVKDDIGSDYNIIFCKNMMIYLSDPARNQLLKKIHSALKPDGYLFLGASEIIQMPEHFTKKLFNGGTVYLKNTGKNKTAFTPSTDFDEKKTKTTHSQISQPLKKNIDNSQIDNKIDDDAFAFANFIVRKIYGTIDSGWVNEDYCEFNSALDEMLESPGSLKFLLDCSRLEFIDHESCIKIIKVVKMLDRRGAPVQFIIPNTALRNKFIRAAGDYTLKITAEFDCATLFLNNKR